MKLRVTVFHQRSTFGALLLVFGICGSCKPRSAPNSGAAPDRKTPPASAAGAPAAPPPARASALLTGTNIVNMSEAAEKQDAMVAELKAAHVEIVRTGINELTGPDADKRFGFVGRLSAAGIKTNLVVKPQFPIDAPMRQHVPGFDHEYAGHPLSSADPGLSATYYQALLQKLEDKSVVLASLELGNELNGAAFNPEFPLPGHGQIYGLSDLEKGDDEARQVAKGFLQYVKVIATLKEARDHSHLNRSTPIITFGLAQTGTVGVKKGGRTDGVATHDTVQFLRNHGVDKYADAYGVHLYPYGVTLPSTVDHVPGLDAALADCGVGGSKPCWMTEWGVPTAEYSCPFDDSARALVVRTIMQEYRGYFAQGRLVGALQYFWGPLDGDPDISKSSSVHRCGAVTASGKEAFAH